MGSKYPEKSRVHRHATPRPNAAFMGRRKQGEAQHAGDDGVLTPGNGSCGMVRGLMPLEGLIGSIEEGWIVRWLWLWHGHRETG